jgi:uncharacterized integral membrane protein
MPVTRDTHHQSAETSESPAQDPDRLATQRPAPAVRSRAGAAWVGICIGTLVLIALVVFMLQNSAPVEVTFLGMRGSAPLALMLLIAGIGVGIVALVIGSLRIGQLRRRIRADRSPVAQVSRAASDRRASGHANGDESP